MLARATRSRLAARLLFGGAFLPLEPGDRYFDATTVALRDALREHLPRGARLLDVGTGASAVLGLWAWRERGARVVCTELDPRALAGAAAAIRANGAPLSLVRASLLAGVAGPFDAAVFNPPYVATAVGAARGLPAAWRSQWDGGPDGARAIRAFLDELAAARRIGTALLGVNRRHVAREHVLFEIDARRAPGAELCFERAWRHPWLPVDVYVFVSRKSPIASESSPLE